MNTCPITGETDPVPNGNGVVPTVDGATWSTAKSATPAIARRASSLWMVTVTPKAKSPATVGTPVMADGESAPGGRLPAVTVTLRVQAAGCSMAAL